MSLNSDFFASLIGKIFKSLETGTHNKANGALYDFVAVDFETANFKRDPCQIGLAMVKDGKIVNTFSSLINPHADFDIACINIHGITKASVQNAKCFEDIYYEVLQPLVGKYPFVAHNATFDRDVLMGACRKCGIDVPESTFYCTYSLSKRNFPTLGSYKLDDLCEVFSVELVNHHDAAADAAACAKIFMCLLENKNIDVFPLNSCSNDSLRHKESKGNSKLIKPDVVYDDCKIDIDGKRFALTGDVAGLKREDVVAAIESAGGIYSRNVTRSTDYLAIGVEDSALVADKASGKTNKINYAETLRDSGVDIKLIPMEDLTAILQKVTI